MSSDPQASSKPVDRQKSADKNKSRLAALAPGENIKEKQVKLKLLYVTILFFIVHPTGSEHLLLSPSN